MKVLIDESIDQTLTGISRSQPMISKMASHEQSLSPTPREQQNHDQQHEDRNNMQRRAQEHDETMNVQDNQVANQNNQPMHERNESSDQAMVARSVLAVENSAMVNEFGTQIHGGLPLQESGEGDQVMVARSVLAVENSAMLNEFGTQMHGGLPLQESGEGDQVMVAGSVLAGENSAMVNEFGTQVHGGLPLQESGEGDQGMVARSVLAVENSVMVHETGTQMHGGLPLQESGDGEMLYPPPQVDSNANIMEHFDGVDVQENNPPAFQLYEDLQFRNDGMDDPGDLADDENIEDVINLVVVPATPAEL